MRLREIVRQVVPPGELLRRLAVSTWNKPSTFVSVGYRSRHYPSERSNAPSYGISMKQIPLSCITMRHITPTMKPSRSSEVQIITFVRSHVDLCNAPGEIDCAIPSIESLTNTRINTPVANLPAAETSINGRSV